MQLLAVSRVSPRAIVEHVTAISIDRRGAGAPNRKAVSYDRWPGNRNDELSPARAVLRC